MSTPEQYRAYARESLQSAAKANTEPERLAFLEMANTWERAALQLEGSLSTAPNTATARSASSLTEIKDMRRMPRR